MTDEFDFTQLSQIEQIQVMGALDPLIWVVSNKIKLGGHTFTLKNHEYQAGIIECNDRVQVIIKGAQMGCALSLDTLLPTPSGFITMGAVAVGDVLFDNDGRECNVTFVTDVQNNNNCYKIEFDDGSQVIADGEHKWNVYNIKQQKSETVTTNKLFRLHLFRGAKRHRYAINVARVVGSEQELPIDPYLLGLWLGDGHSASATLTCHKDDCIDYSNWLSKNNWEFKVSNDKRNIDVRYISIKNFYKKLRLTNLIKNKHIPLQYLRGTVDQRLELLRGLIDTDGHIRSDGQVEFYQNDGHLVDQVKELIASLGYKVRKRFKADTCYWGTQVKKNKSMVLRFVPSVTLGEVAKLSRKVKNQKIKIRDEVNKRFIKHVTKTDSVPVKCITVDSPDHLYLCTESFIPTHNTETWVLKTLWGMIHGRYPKGSLYLFPTQNDVGDFSKARFDPLIEANQCIASYVNSTDSQFIKRIHEGFLYLRGARATKAIGGEKKSSAQLKSIPVDRIVFDERDEMTDEMVTLAEERVSHSDVQELMFLGTPTIPDIGVDAMYKISTQNMWYIKCEHCGHETCLEIEFPNCIKIEPKTGHRYRACMHCSKEIFPRNGHWVSACPGKDITGWWISQLNSMYVKPGKILDLYNTPPNGDLSEIMNSKLGRAYIAQENRLTQNLVWNCCSSDLMGTRSDGPCFSGVDVGKKLHAVIGLRKTRDLLKIVHVARLDDWNELHDLNQRFNVSSCVIDYKPEIHKVRDFQQQEPYTVWAADYVERKIGGASWDEKNLTVKTNRTEICDATHDLVITPGRLELPARNKELEQFAFEMCNMAKKLEDDPFGGKVYRYRQLGNDITGPDHYRHALNYALLASERTGIESDSELINKYFKRRLRRSSSSWMSV